MKKRLFAFVIAIITVVSFALCGCGIKVIVGSDDDGKVEISIGGDSGFDFKYSEGDSYAAEGATLESKIDKLQVNWMDGEVELLSCDDENVKFEETADQTLTDELKLRWKLKNGCLIIKYCASGSFNFGRLNKKLKIYIPSDLMLDSIDVSTTSGEINVPAVNVKEISMTTTSGDVKSALGDVEKIKVTTTSGDSVIEAGKVSTIEVGGTSGNTSVKTTSVKKLTSSKTSGGCALITDDVDTVEMNATSGLQAITIPDSLGFTANVSSTSGRLSTDFACSIKNEKYIYKDGKAKFDFNVTSGAMWINRK